MQAQSIIEKGKELYYRLKPLLVKKYGENKYVSFEVESGKYFVADSSIESLKKAKKNYPSKQFFVAQIGNLAGMLK